MTKKEDYLKINTCQKCKHTWINRNHQKPRLCPKCKTVTWNDKEAQK